MGEETDLPAQIEIVLGDLAGGLETAAEPLPKADGVVLGRLVAFREDGAPLVHFEGCADGAPVAALVVGSLSDDDVGADVALALAAGDARRPVVLGRTRAAIPAAERARAASPLETSADGQTVALTAGRQLVLRVGRATITLTQDGRIVIRGGQLVSRASGVNRIQGGSVQIN
ncbi:MAG TPA: DUF6484 domain-containing protein [Myxococcota bacterium]|nr:DUF6484 domain-containing protein [Myxococcota bacterium]